MKLTTHHSLVPRLKVRIAFSSTFPVLLRDVNLSVNIFGNLGQVFRNKIRHKFHNVWKLYWDLKDHIFLGCDTMQSGRYGPKLRRNFFLQFEGRTPEDGGKFL
jgi:hypothetical protein